MNYDQDNLGRDMAGSTSDSQTSPDINDARASPENIDGESGESIVSENGDTVGSLRHIGVRRHVDMAGLYSSGPSRPRTRQALADPSLRPALVRPTLNRPSMALSMRINGTSRNPRRVPSQRNLRRMQSQRNNQEPQMKVQNFQDYLKMQQMQSVRRFDNAWNLDEPEEEEKNVDLPSMSDHSSELSIDIHAVR